MSRKKCKIELREVDGKLVEVEVWPIGATGYTKEQLESIRKKKRRERKYRRKRNRISYGFNTSKG